jgi:hypothetical protein
MTCIIACKHEGKIHMIGDIMGSDGFVKDKFNLLSKVFKCGDFLIGYTSSFRMGQILQYNWSAPEQGSGTDDDTYIFRDVVRSFKTCFDNNFYGQKDSTEFQAGEFLVGWKGRLFKMQNNLSLLELNEFGSAGCGEYHAIASMKTQQMFGINADDPLGFLESALSIAEDSVSGVSAEYTYIKED